MKTIRQIIWVGLLVWGGGLFAQAARPVISHEAPSSVVSGQPLGIVARVRSAEPLQSVRLYLTQTGGAEPVALPMQASGAGVYSLRVDPRYFSSAGSFRYYLDARTVSGVWTETNWMTVRVIGSAAERAEDEEAAWVRPILVGGGAALAVGAGVALAGSGGGGGSDSTEPDPPDGNPADSIIVRSVSDRIDTADPALPRGTVVDAADELGGRSIDRVRIRIEFDAVDGGAEQLEVSYNGSVVLVTTVDTTLTDQVDVLGADSAQVVIRVLDSVPVEGTSTYRWTATVSYFLQ